MSAPQEEPRSPCFVCPICGFEAYGICGGFGSTGHLLREHGVLAAVAWLDQHGTDWRSHKSGYAADGIKRRLREDFGLEVLPRDEPVSDAYLQPPDSGEEPEC